MNLKDRIEKLLEGYYDPEQLPDCAAMLLEAMTDEQLYETLDRAVSPLNKLELSAQWEDVTP